MLDNRRWRALLAYVASTRAEPLYYIQTILIGHAPGGPDPQLELHADTFHPSLKAWLFLTDVTDDQAPLTYVPGSHRLTPERLAWEQARSVTINDSDRLSQRGSFADQAGRTAQRSVCLHPSASRFRRTRWWSSTRAASTPGEARTGRPMRAEIWAYARRTPFVPWAGFDLLSCLPIAIRRAEWLPHIVDRLDRLGLKKQHWHSAGRKRAIDP